MDRTERRKERIKLMHKLNHLETMRCAKCRNGRGDYEEMNCRCKAAVAIRMVGVEMSRNQAAITVEKYQELHSKGISDREISSRYGIYPSKLHRFKVKHGLAKKTVDKQKIK